MRISMLVLAAMLAAHAAPAQERAGAIGHETVAAARQALLAKPGVSMSEPQGWLIVNDPGELALWSFTPVGHAAHPAVVKRIVEQREGTVSVRMLALCEAPKVECDKLVHQFQQLTEKMKRDLQRGRQR